MGCNIIMLGMSECPKCFTLQRRLDNKNINYQLIKDDVKKAKEYKILSYPCLVVDGNVMTFDEAMEWTKGV